MDVLLLLSLFVVCNVRSNMPDGSYGLCDMDSSEVKLDVAGNGEYSVIYGVSIDCMKKRRQCGGAAKMRARAQARLNNAKRKHLHHVKESTEQMRIHLDTQKVRACCCCVMKRQMAENGESPMLCFDGLEDNREVPIRFDNIEVMGKSGGIEERQQAVPGEARWEVNREFVARVRANMVED